MVEDIARKIALGIGGIGLFLSAGTCVDNFHEIVDLSKNKFLISHTKTQEVLENLELKKKSFLEKDVYIPNEFYSNSKIDELNNYASPKKEIDPVFVQKLDSAIYETKEDLDSISGLPEYQSAQEKISKNRIISKNSTRGGLVSLVVIIGTCVSYYLSIGKRKEGLL